MISPWSIAVCGTMTGLCALDRADIKTKLLGNKDFREFLELAPEFRELLLTYIASEYSRFFALLAKVKV